MNYFGISKSSVADGKGVRVVLWLAGCNHGCKGCQNPETWGPYSGEYFGYESRKELWESLDKEYIDGITFSGGDPLHANNVSEVHMLINKFRKKFPNKNIWIYSGYTWEEIFDANIDIEDADAWLRRSVISNSDFFVDGKFELDKRDITLAFRGSSNQRIIDVKATKEQNKIVEVM